MAYRKIFSLFVIPITLLFLFALPSPALTYWIWSPESGKFVSSDSMSQEESEDLLRYALSLREEKSGERTIAELENLLRKFPSSHVAPEAQFQIGLIYEENGDYNRAFEAYKKLSENYPQSEKSDEVIEKIFNIGQIFLGGHKDRVAGVVNISRLPKSVEVFEHIVKIAPFGKFGDQAQFHVGAAYKAMGRFREAVDAFQKFVDRYPSSALLDDAYFQLADSSYAFSQKAARDQYAVEDAITNISNYLAKYPASAASDKVRQLKKEIEEQDAEKNFRIGVYYETQNELESARLYFEEVSRHYPDTAAGRQAAEKLKALGTSIEAVREGQRALDEKMEEIEAKLKGLDYERDQLRSKIKAQGDLATESEELKRLEEARSALESRRVGMHSNLERRLLALKTREMAWRAKRKNFEEKRKELKSNSAPELLAAFERWEESLSAERTELDKERQALVQFQSELGIEPKRRGYFRIPFVSKRAVPLQQAVDYKRKDIEKIRSERQAVEKKRMELERQLEALALEAGSVDRKDFSDKQKSAAFQTTLGAERSDLKAREARLASEEEQLKALIEVFRVQKMAYQKKYGGDFAENLALDLSAVEGSAGLDFALSQSSKKALTQELQQDKVRLVDALVEQKRLVMTLSSAFDTEVAKGKLVITEEAGAPDKPAVKVDFAKKDEYKLTPEELKLDQRDLRKRIKHIEREMRKHFDEIEDWNQKKQKMVKELDDLMNSDRRESAAAKVLKPVTAPLRFMFWLTRSLAFGLSSYDRQIVQQAKHRTASSDSDADHEKVRSLHQEIELQTILIQSRHEEILRMSNQIKALEKRLQSVRRDDQALRHVFLEKQSARADESLRSAEQIVAEEDRLPILIGKIDAETKRLRDMERELNEIDEKLMQVGKALASLEASPAALPLEAAGSLKSEGEISEEKKKNEEELILMKQKIESGAKSFQADKSVLEREMYDFYKQKRESSTIAGTAAPTDAKRQQKNMRRELDGLIDFERKLLRSELGALQDKEHYLAKELKQSRGRDDLIRHQAIFSEQERVKADLAEVRAALEAFKS